MTDARIDWLEKLEYLGLTEAEASGIVHPFERRTPRDLEEPHMHLLRLMRDPDYFWLTCKVLFDLDLGPFQCVILKEMWNHRFPMLIGCRGLGKSFLLAIYALLRAIFKQGSKVVICGSGFRQAKTVFNYAENVWHNSPTLRSLFAGHDRSGPEHGQDRWVLRLGESTITALPVGVDGAKIRGERANCILADEFASIPLEIFETVISGFGVVSLSPIMQAKRRARLRVLRKLGALDEEGAATYRATEEGNQIIFSGTAFYQFNHFYSYWRRWKGIVESRGEPKKLREIFGGEPEKGFDWRHYCVIRVPVHLLPEGFMDEEQVARSRGTIHSGTFANEFGAVFSGDSNGFFKRSLIQACVTTNPVTPAVEGAAPVQFKPSLRGTSARTYVMGVDPASEKDNFAIVILEIHEDHRRVVYCWTTNKERFRERVRGQRAADETYYAYCARKIRELLRVFPCEVISLDTQGGGLAGVLEALHDPEKAAQGERPIWPVTPDHPLSDGKERPEDAQAGLHMVELVNFARAEYTSGANHGLRKDLEDRVLLFPMRDAVQLYEAHVEDVLKKRDHDTLEECQDEIDDLIDELTTIQHTQTPGTLRDKWDTPETKEAGSKKGRLRKDRYSALLMANHAARRLHRLLEPPPYEAHGGFADAMTVAAGAGPDMYSFAPEWFTREAAGHYDDYGWAG